MEITALLFFLFINNDYFNLGLFATAGNEKHAENSDTLIKEFNGQRTNFS